MIGILVTAHGTLAEGLVTSAGMIIGRVPLLRAVGLKSDQGLEELKRNIETAWADLEREGADQILVLVDMFGGSCSNVAVQLVYEKDAARAAIVTGVNLPMILETVIDRDIYPLHELVAKMIEAGKKSILDVRAVMAEKLR